MAKNTQQPHPETKFGRPKLPQGRGGDDDNKAGRDGEFRGKPNQG